MFYVYIMTNSNNKVLYTGVTNDLNRRVYEHKNKLVKGFTQRYNVNKLVYFDTSTSIKAAIAREKEIKGWRRERKNQLINNLNPDWGDLANYFFVFASTNTEAGND